MEVYLVKASYERQTDQGIKRVSESYLLDAMSFTEAEARIKKELAPYVCIGEVDVKGVKRVKYDNLILSEDPTLDRYYRVRVLFVELDDNGLEKSKPANFLIQDDGIGTALEILKSNLREITVDYRIVSIVETDILGFFRYVAPEEV